MFSGLVGTSDGLRAVLGGRGGRKGRFVGTVGGNLQRFIKTCRFY